MPRFFKFNRAVFTRPEMRLFWAALVLLAAIAGLALSSGGGTASLIILALAIGVGGIVFISSFFAANTNLTTVLERNELQSIIFGLSDALVVYDQNFVVSYFNPSAEELFQVKASSVIGKRIEPREVENASTRLLAQVIFPSLAPTLVTRTKSGEYPQVSDISFVDPVLELRVTTTPISDERGRLMGFMKIVRNRTREVTLLKSKEEFITVASHQLRTPITELSWALEASAKDETLRPDTKGLLDHALVSATKVQALVEDLLSISKMEEGRFGYNLQPGNLGAFLEKILAELLPQAEHAGIKLYLDRPKEELPQVLFDSAKLGMVVSNLIDNAIRYNVPNGNITVSLLKSAQGPYLEVRVKDTGIGVPADEMRHIFTKFYRSTNALKFQTEGSGLGLYIAKNIIQAHGGQMWAESELNRGSTFAFSLPTDPSLVPPKEVALE